MSSSEDTSSSSWGDLDEYEKIETKKIEDSRHGKAPSAGTVRIVFTLDGAALPSTAVSGRVLVSVWNSLNRCTTLAPVSWAPNSSQTKSRSMQVTLSLNDEYEYAILKRSMETKPSYVLGSLRTDSNVWFEVLVEEPSLMTNTAVYGRYGAGFASVAELVEVSRDNKANVAVPLVLFDATSASDSHKLMQRATVFIQHVDFGEDTLALQKLSNTQHLLTLEPSMFEVNQHNIKLLSSLTGSAIGRQLYAITNNDNLKLRGTRPINTRVIAPWYQTHQPIEGVNRLPIHGYFIDQHALNELPSQEGEDEAYMMAVFGYAARRRNMTLSEMGMIMDKQLDSEGEKYNPLYTECMAIMGRAFVLMSNTFAYQSDMHNMSDRAHRYLNRAAAATKQVGDESWNRAQRNAGGDCEDLAHYAYAHAQMLRRGSWTSAFLRTAQRALSMYVPMMMLGTVTSPALGNKHDAAKSASHLSDAEHHHAVIRAAGGYENVEKHMVRSETSRFVHMNVVRGSKADLNLPEGGHSWFEMIPRHKVNEFVRRLVPETDVATGSEAQVPWRYFVPHLVLEGTGRINPLFMPSAYYATPAQNREALRMKDLQHMRTFHNLISTSRVFHSMQSEAQPTSTVNTPHERMTSFYVQSTQSFTDEFLHSTGCVAFNWFQLQADAPVHEQPADPLFAEGDALRGDRIREAKHAFVQSEAGSAAHAFSAKSPTCLKTEAIGQLCGEKQSVPFEASQLSLGVDLEQRICDRPFAPNIALVPTANIEPLEAKALASQLRQCFPAEKPSSRLKHFTTDPKLPISFVRESAKDKNEVDPLAMAKLVHNEKLVGEQNRYIEQTTTGVRKLFVNEPWLSRKQAEKRSLNLQTFFVAPHDLTSARAPELIVGEVKRKKDEGIVKCARVYVEEPVQNFRTVVLQMLCVDANSAQ